MRLAALLGCRVFDAEGVEIGGVHDARFTVDAGTAGSPACLTALIVGSAAVGHRLGYERHQMAGPWPLPMLMRRLARNSYLVEWTDVETFERPNIRIRRRRNELRRLTDDNAERSR